ncbi:MAG: cell division protein [Bdellovibrio sp. CG10_big_fil_rev_8_21_14_0_10_47_8]|nr:MAG: cell division protein [Bdellovibrio sp. CG10_big_fil_rev_8_21_14_0_10_47_8]
MKKTLFKIFMSLVVIPTFVVGVLYWLNERGFFNLQQIELAVEGNDQGSNFLKPLLADLNKELETYRGTSLWSLDLPEVSEKVKKMRWIQGSSLSRRWPHQLSVRILPREVKLLFVSQNGKLLPIVEDGSFLQPVAAGEAPDVSLLAGDVFEKNVEMRKKAVTTISEIPDEGRFSRKTISELRYDSKEGFWATLIQSGMKVKIGDGQVSLRAARVSQVIEYMESRQLEARVIDANLSKKVLVRLRKGP